MSKATTGKAHKINRLNDTMASNYGNTGLTKRQCISVAQVPRPGRKKLNWTLG